MGMDIQTLSEQIKDNFVKSRKVLVATGDETRQLIITALMDADCEGMRVGEITSRTHLSRPAVSHHIKILLDCGLVKRDRQGTKNYYRLHVGEEFMHLYDLVKGIAMFKEAAEALEDDHAI
jgi:ArsR family transcriptional regulator